MKTLKTNKVDAARCQTDVAIQLLFAGKNEFSVITLASAAFRTLRDLAEANGNCKWHESIKKIIRPGKEKEFWKAVNSSANFLKHADKDPDDLLEIDCRAVDLCLSACCTYYYSLGYEPTDEMKVLSAFVIIMYPDLLVEDSARDLITSNEVMASIRNLTREESLSLCKDALKTKLLGKGEII